MNGRNRRAVKIPSKYRKSLGQLWRARRRPVLFAVLLVSLALSVGTDEKLQASVFGRPYVVDGDTLHMDGRKIRLFGIDAPENGQFCKDAKGVYYDCGRAARVRLRALIGRGDIRCTAQDEDQYGRDVSICYAGDIDVNAKMVREGWAVAYRHYSHRYVDEEGAAKREKRGIWSGSFTTPSRYRRQKR